MFKTVLKIKTFYPFIYILLGIVLILFGRFEVSSDIRMPLSYIFEPVSFVANNLGSSVSNWGSALFDASSYIEGYEKLQNEFAELKAKESTSLDYEEYMSLKQNQALITSGGEYVMAKILNYSNKGDVYINMGIEDGIKEGDIVLIGNIFLGVVQQADRNGSLVRLPINVASSYEVVVLPSTYGSENEILLDGYIKSSGVVSGDLEGIKIENISINSQVSDGDLVVLRDERIGMLLVVGRVVGLSNNPAATSKSGFVSPVLDYSNLLTVFVRIK